VTVRPTVLSEAILGISDKRFRSWTLMFPQIGTTKILKQVG